MTARRLARMLVALVLCFVSTRALVASPGPENVAVVVNDDSWASKALANHFVSMRGIPAGNVVHLQLGDLVNFEVVGIDTFRDRILKPVLEQLQKRALKGQVDCIAWSSDIPWGVDITADYGENIPKRGYQKYRRGSLTGMTFLYPFVLKKDVRYTQLGNNLYFRRTGPAQVRKPWTADQRKQMVEATQLLKQKKLDDSRKLLEALAEQRPEDPSVHYNLACCLALQDQDDAAMKALAEAVEHGWSNKRHTEQDEDLKNLRERDDFKTLIGSMASPLVKPGEPVPFRNATPWGPTGQPAAKGKGINYMMSTMLGVTSGRGNSVEEVIEAMDRGAAADGTRPSGTVYYMINGDIRSKTRQPMFASAVKALEGAGVKAEAVDGKLPDHKDDCMGVMAGWAGFDWGKSGSTLMPGAIAEHLTSFGAVMDQFSGQTPISAFVRAGAAGSSGTVIEPFALWAKFPTPFIHYYYARGATLAEAFYMSVAGPYQLLVLGDPLVRPWAVVPQITVKGLRDGQTVKGSVALTAEATAEVKAAVKRFELYADGKLVTAAPAGDTLKLDTTRLADGWHRLRVAAVMDDVMEARGTAALEVMVDNSGQAVKTRLRSPGKVRLDETISLGVSVPGAARLELLHLGRAVATVDGARGKLETPAARIGLGPSRLTVAATMGEGDMATRVALWPVDLEVTLPRQLKAARVRTDDMVNGLTLVIDGNSTTVPAVRERRKWTDLGIVGGKPFELSCYVEAGRDGLHQLQVHYAGELTVTVDGMTTTHPKDRAWTFVPLNLEKGLHQITVGGTGVKGAKPDVRFGYAGPRSLGGKSVWTKGE